MFGTGWPVRAIRLGAIAVIASGLALSNAIAKDLVIGTQGLALSMDPLFALDTASLDNNSHIYESLITYDADENVQPRLAVSWESIDERTWEFTLRKGVRFHDGKELRAKDAVASLRRAMREVPGSSSPYTQFFVGVAEIVAVDDYTFRVISEKPSPLFPADMDWVSITPAHVAEQADNDAFNSGKLAIGTGPYRFKRFLPNNTIELVRNDDYWGPSPQWETVTFKQIKNSGSRVAALLAGDVDMINLVPPQDMQRLQRQDSVAVWQKVSDRLVYLLMDQHRDVTPHVVAKDGEEIKNPLKIAEVRRALAMAIDQGAIVKNVMRGMAVEANQPLVGGMPGFSGTIPANADDLEGARALLEEAGFASGFKVTLHGPDGRYLNDAQVTQALGQMLSRLGLDVTVETLPSQIFSSRGNKLDYSLALYGFRLDAGPPTLQWLLHSRNKEAGWGASNRGRYANARVDAITEEVFQTFDADKRAAMVEEASEIVMSDLGIIPLYHQVTVWATRAGLTYEGRIDARTLAMGVTAN